MKSNSLTPLVLAFGLTVPVAATAQYGVSTDVWDVSSGTTVTRSSSPAIHFSGKPFRPEALLGGTPAGFGEEVGSFTFADGRSAGVVHFVEWKTATPVKLSSLKVYAAGDGPVFNNQREFNRVVIRAKTAGSTEFNTVLTDSSVTHPYTFVDAANYVVVNQAIPDVVAQEFRAEFVDRGLNSFSGPRVLEIDGFGEKVEEPHIGSRTDLWDSSRGTVVTAASEMDQYFDGRLYNPLNIFGTNSPGFLLEPGSVVFADGKPQGFAHFVEWKTAAPVTVKSFRLYAAGDGPTYANQREFAEFNLYAKSVGSGVFDRLIYRYSANRPYNFLKFSDVLLTEANIDPVTAQEFRAEFIASGKPALNGPRILELDAFAEELPLVARANHAVEVSWTSVAGRIYQVQWKNNSTETWTNLGTPVVGNGAAASVFDRTQDAGLRIYRIVELVTP
jgi:hypothetical protein